jgi:hypothetical protein
MISHNSLRNGQMPVVDEFKETVNQEPTPLGIIFCVFAILKNEEAPLQY